MALRKKYSCKFPECSNSYYWSKDNIVKAINKHFYRFPKNPDISTKWKMICGIDINMNCRNMYICEDHFQKEDFLNFTKHLLKPNIIPKHIEMSNNLVPIQISAVFEKDAINNNYCQPIINETSSAVCNDFSNKDVNINVDDTFINNDTVSNKTLNKISNETSNEICNEISSETSIETFNENSNESCYNNSMFQNTLHYNNDSQTENSLQLLIDADKSEPICICDDENCTDKKCTSSNEIQLNSVSTFTISKEKRKSGFLTQVGITSKTMSPQKSIMYSIHRKTTAQLCKMKKKLCDQRNALAQLKAMSDNNIFHCIERKLNEVTKHFIQSQLRNVDRTPCGKRWTEEDKAFALSIYKRSPRVYKYLSTYFQRACPV